MIEFPKFEAPKPYELERYEGWLSRVVQEFEDWANSTLRTIADAAAQPSEDPDVGIPTL